MSDYWRKKYDEILDFLKEKFGSAWVLSLLEDVEGGRRSEIMRKTEVVCDQCGKVICSAGSLEKPIVALTIIEHGKTFDFCDAGCYRGWMGSHCEFKPKEEKGRSNEQGN
jgi:hypothetical protein